MIHVPLPLAGLAVPFVGACGVLAWRIKETQRPLTYRRIVIPPVAMSTGFGMFMAPIMRVPIAWALGTFLAGATVFALPLIHTSKLTVLGDEVYLSRSRAFLWVLLALVVVRLALREQVALYISPQQTAALFFILAFGMIVHWRVDMLTKFRQLREEIRLGHQERLT